MQSYLDLAVMGYLLLGIGVGFAVGYIIGGMSRLRPLDRVILGVIISAIAGLISGLLLTEFIPPGEISLLIVVVSSLGGCAFGEIVRWAPLPPKPAKRYVVYEPDDDDAFDREIEEAFGGSQ
ncbi:MAG: hypothetical protein P1Q69_01630 [Candidatus Thorarchaeota archaeon]|nr:hypothetical protein [Candidatus Thorarchaeota archaeon]